MKLAMVVYLFVSLFGSGFAFLSLNSHFAGRRFTLNMKSAATSVWVSVLFSMLSSTVHHQFILLGEHLIFDALGSIFFAVMLSCGIALVRELCFSSRKKSHQKAARRSNVTVIRGRGHAAPVPQRRSARIAA